MNRFKPTHRYSAGVLIAFAVVAVVTLALTFSTVRDLVISWKVTGLDSGTSFTPANSDPTSAHPQATVNPNAPLQPASGPAALPWDGKSRVNILLMGLDYRDWEAGQGPPRTDTMILITVDPLSNSAGVLSIPRDMWVPIPGHGNGKINTAYQIGAVEQLPGGGPGLAIKTVEEFVGVAIHYYAQIDFSAFERMIDEIGGVKLDFPKKIVVDPIGPGNTKTIKPGVHTISGSLTLAYVRARNTPGGDFDRAERQQQVMLAIRDRILTFELLPVLISKAPVLYQELAGGLHTNMTLDQAIRLALLMQHIPRENIHQGLIGIEEVTFGRSPDGLDILQPIPDRVRLVRDAVFTASGSISPAAPEKPLENLVQEEAAKIAVLNGTRVPGLAAATTEYLETFHLDITLTDNAPQVYALTTITDYTGKPYTLQYLINLLAIDPSRVFQSFAPNSEVDIEISLGNDWANSGTLP